MQHMKGGSQRKGEGGRIQSSILFSTFAFWGRSARLQYVSPEVPLYLKKYKQKTENQNTLWLHANCLLAAAGL